MLDFENLEKYRENNRIEAKQALGGLPESIWETYSAFANAQGGVILLGVEELADKSLHALDLLDPQWLLDDFWSLVRDPKVASINILRPEDVQVHIVDGKQIIAINVPEAKPEEKPVYIENDLWRGTYYRSGEGDYRCSDSQIKGMLSARNHGY